MISFIRKHLSYANIALTAALVFAMSGGAFALGSGSNTATNTGSNASAAHGRAVATAAKKAKKGKAKSSKGTKGPAGPAGKAGATGPEGKTGATGAEGKTGAVGPEGKTGAAGPEGKAGVEGKQGESGQTGYTEYLPEGKTETGYFALVGYATAEKEKQYLESAISFNIPLELDGAYIPAVTIGAGEESTNECPGTVQEPKAKEGYLCLYEAKAVNLELNENAPGPPYPSSQVKAERMEDNGTRQSLSASGVGALVWVKSKEAGLAESIGTWAVTAP